MFDALVAKLVGRADAIDAVAAPGRPFPTNELENAALLRDAAAALGELARRLNHIEERLDWLEDTE